MLVARVSKETDSYRADWCKGNILCHEYCHIYKIVLLLVNVIDVTSTSKRLIKIFFKSWKWISDSFQRLDKTRGISLEYLPKLLGLFQHVSCKASTVYFRHSWAYHCLWKWKNLFSGWRAQTSVYVLIILQDNGGAKLICEPEFSVTCKSPETSFRVPFA